MSYRLDESIVEITVLGKVILKSMQCKTEGLVDAERGDDQSGDLTAEVGENVKPIDVDDTKFLQDTSMHFSNFEHTDKHVVRHCLIAGQD